MFLTRSGVSVVRQWIPVTVPRPLTTTGRPPLRAVPGCPANHTGVANEAGAFTLRPSAELIRRQSLSCSTRNRRRRRRRLSRTNADQHRFGCHDIEMEIHRGFNRDHHLARPALPASPERRHHLTGNGLTGPCPAPRGYAARRARVTQLLANPTASGTEKPCARAHAIAAARVSPAP